MSIFAGYRLQETENGYTLLIYLDPKEEFSQEFNKITNNENFYAILKEFINEKFPNLKITAVKVMIGTTLISSFSIGAVRAEASTASYTNYVVQSGDTLWIISNKYNVSIDSIKQFNNLTSDMLYVGQNLKIPTQEQNEVNIIINDEKQQFSPGPLIIEGATYVPVRQVAAAIGASVWYNSESKTIGINREDIKIAFVIGSTSARVNGELVSTSQSRVINNTTYVPVRLLSETFGMKVSWDGNTKTVYISEVKPSAYTVAAGDSLWIIANRFGTTVNALKELNNLSTDTIYVGQSLLIPPAEEKEYTEPSVTYITHTVKQGDNLWSLSIQYGIPQSELLKVNNMTMDSVLSIGQELTIPVHHITEKPVVSARHGELLDWWTEAQYIFIINKTAKVTDFETGRSFYVKRTIGANHSDTEPLTASDTAVIKDIWGGSFSWVARAVIVEVDGRGIAASMTSMPHSIQYIDDNNFDGHFDIHFLNSTRHRDGEITPEHQAQIKIAAGITTH